MLSLFHAYFSPMFSLFLLTLGASILTTIQTVILHQEHISTLIIGIITAGYYLGFVYAAFSVEKFILRVAHIRAYAAFTALFSSLVIFQGVFIVPELWILERILAGVCIAGLFVVIESWMLTKSTPKIRGQALALYMFVYYGAQSLAQFFLNIGYANKLLLFAIASMLCTLSIVPMAMTKMKAPEIGEPSVLNFKNLYRKSPSGVLGCFVSGILIGPIYGLMPIFIAAVNGTDYIANGMAICILGGMLCQYPFGRLSDHIDRRTVIVLVFGIILLTSAVLFAIDTPLWLWYILLFIFGGANFVIYPISMSHACDVLDSKDMIAATQGLVLGNSLGMVIGPLICSLLLSYYHPRASYLGFFAIISALMILFFGWRIIVKEAEISEQEFIGLPRITPVAVEIDPRIEEE